jgi:hypothetical protein
MSPSMPALSSPATPWSGSTRSPPFGIEGVDAKADGVPLGFAPGIDIGALAIGRIKFELQHALLRRIHSAEAAAFITHREADEVALELVGSGYGIARGRGSRVY